MLHFKINPFFITNVPLLKMNIFKVKKKYFGNYKKKKKKTTYLFF